MCFVLGNLTAKNEQARLRLFQEREGMDTLLTVLKTYDEFDAQVGQAFDSWGGGGVSILYLYHVMICVGLFWPAV